MWFNGAQINLNDEETDEAVVGLIEQERSSSTHNKRGKSVHGQHTFNVALIGCLVVSNLFWGVATTHLWKLSHDHQNDRVTDFGEWDQQKLYTLVNESYESICSPDHRFAIKSDHSRV